MASRSTDASIAFSVTDNLSQSVVKMKNSINEFRSDAEGLQQRLTMLENTRLQLKNIDLKQAREQVDQTRKAMEALGEAATDAEREAAQADFDKAIQNYANVEGQLQLVSRQARQTQTDLLNATGAIQSFDNRAGGSGGTGMLAALGKAGMYDMLGDVASQWAGALVSSAAGSDAGTLFSSALSGVGSGAAIGTMIGGPVGTAVGAALGGLLGLTGGASQVFQSQDEAFKSYYQDLYQQGQTEAADSLTSGSSTAAQRELDAIAFNRLLGDGVGNAYLEDLRTLAADTPMEYSDLTSMSRALATGFGDAPDRMLELMTAIGDAGSAVGVTADDMSYMAQSMSRMQSSGKATLEYLNIFQERGVDVIGMLAEAMGKTQGEIYDMISKGQINGQTAVDVIQAGMEERYGGAMETMAQTFSGLTSTLEDAMTEIDAARGEGYNAERSQGLQAEIDAYGGPLGDAVSALNTIAGQNEAYLENLSDQYTREALSAVLLGEPTSDIFSPEMQQELADMRAQYEEAADAYASGDQEAGLKMENLRREAEALATAAYESSDAYQLVHDAELDLIEAIRENTAALDGWRNNYDLQQAQSKGLGLIGVLGGISGSGSTGRSNYHDLGYDRQGTESSSRSSYHAYGLNRVPYDGYAAILHEGERVLTAREAREADRGTRSPININIGGTWQVRSDQDVDAIAEAIWRRVELASRAGVRR